MKFLSIACVLLAASVLIRTPAIAQAGQNLPPPVAFCVDHPAACGPCPNCAKGQIDITIKNAAGEKTCIANGGTVVMNASGNKVCGGQYMRRTPPSH